MRRTGEPTSRVSSSGQWYEVRLRDERSAASAGKYECPAYMRNFIRRARESDVTEIAPRIIESMAITRSYNLVQVTAEGAFLD